MEYHVFISYRRDGGDIMAQLLYDRLKASGYQPFLDIEHMRSGPFNTQLYDRIRECKDFILILPPNALDRCADPDDWVRCEIKEAIRSNKNIVPFMMRGFSFPDDLPEEIDEIRTYQGVKASQEHFDSTFDKLKALLTPIAPLASSGLSPDETDASLSHEEIVARNKAQRIESAKSCLIMLLAAAVTAAIMYALNALLRGWVNHWLDIWFASGEQAAPFSSLPIYPLFIALTSLIPIFGCGWLLGKGYDIDSPTLKITSCLLFILSILILHLLPYFVITLLALALVIFLIRAFF